MRGVNQTNCTVDLNNNQTFISTLGAYFWNTTNYWFSLGWDQEGSDFTNNTYLADSYVDFYVNFYYASQPFLSELVDYGDQWAKMGLNPNFTIDDFLAQCDAVNEEIYGINMAGPGITQNAT